MMNEVFFYSLKTITNLLKSDGVRIILNFMTFFYQNTEMDHLEVQFFS